MSRTLMAGAVALTFSALGWTATVAQENHVHTQAAEPSAEVYDCAIAAIPALHQQDDTHRKGRAKLSDRFPNIELRTQCGTPVKFFDDLVKDRTVVINFMYTTCADICPGATQNLTYVHEALGPHMGEDILMISISLDPAVDTPAVLREYDEIFGGPRPGWLYLTGDYDEIDGLRRALGVYDLDPVIDADRAQHGGILTLGNDRTNSWAALPTMANSSELAKSIIWLTRDARR